MGQTFVYNMGNSEPLPANELYLEYGLFFDGTRNNRKNTEIRKKVEKKGEFKDAVATPEEVEMFKKYAKDDNSFGNDFTNVARKYMCADMELYSIYIEGIGTVGDDEKKRKDDGPGFKYGRGKNGIIEKVEKGCEILSNYIKKYTDKNDKVNKIHLTIDAFGFSRGAAAARNFLYNLQMKPYLPLLKYPPFSSKAVQTDHNGDKIEKSWLKNEKLPPFGYLGTAMLKAGISREIIDNLVLNVRFLGIYDTVASYDPACLLIPDFEYYIKQLHLNDLGRPEKAVHFTAIDEHRKNFSLTRLNMNSIISVNEKELQEYKFFDPNKKFDLNSIDKSSLSKFIAVELVNGIEKNLPGVHSDIGGSYNHDALSLNEIERITKKFKEPSPNPINGVSEREYIILEAPYFFKNQEKARVEFINQGWYKDEQLKIFNKTKRPLFFGTRYLYKGYSFIPLHFMSDYAQVLVNRNSNFLFYDKILTDYALNDAFLEDVKTYLQKHTIEDGKDWNLKSELDIENSSLNDKNLKSEAIFKKSDDSEAALEELEIKVYRSDYMLKELRNKYLHRSAKINTLLDYFAYSPNSDGKRKEF